MKKISAIITLLFIFALSGMYGTPVKDTYASVPEDTTASDNSRLGISGNNNTDKADDSLLGPIKPVDPPVPADTTILVFPFDPDLSLEGEDYIPVDVSNKYNVGTPSGTFDVNSSGAALYNINIDCPDGGPFMPQVGISYNSMSGYGLAGYGCGISGISVITRGGSNLFYDGVVKGTKYTADDNLYLDGKRLFLKSGTPFAEGAVYTPEGDPYTMITVHGTYNDYTATTWFEIKADNGITYYYGNSADSRLSYVNKSGKRRIAAWYICRSEDRLHNYITYSYVTSNLNIRPVQITYGKNSGKDRGITNTVNFTYKSLGDASIPFMIEDMQGLSDVVLEKITTVCNGKTFRTYKLTYDSKSDQSSTKFSRLTQIDELNGNGESMSPVKLSWNFLPGNGVSASTLSVQTKDERTYVEEQGKSFMAADLTNDGVSDIIRIAPVKVMEYSGYGETRWHEQTYVYISRSRVSDNNSVTYDSPLVYSIAPSFSLDNLQSVIGGTSVMDFDGDGYNDLIIPMYNKAGGSVYETFYVIFGSDVAGGRDGTAQNFKTPLTVSDENPLFVTFDADGNGKDDVVYVENKQKDGYYPGGIVYMKEGKNLGSASIKMQLPDSPEKIFTADYNNDGLTDLILLYKNGYTIYYNNGGTSPEQCFTESSKKTGTDFSDSWRVQQGDFDGDGLIDFVYNVSDESWLRIARNNGDGTFTYGRSDDLELNNQSTAKDDNEFTILVWDMDNDGKSDVFVSKAKYVHHGGLTSKNVYDYTRIKWLYSDGTALKVFRQLDKRCEDAALPNYFMLGDFNGDGAMEMANYGSVLTNTSETADEYIHVYKSYYDLAKYGKIRRITDGLGRYISIEYASAVMPSVYTPSADSSYPVNCYTLPVAVVSATGMSAGAAGSQRFKYRYGGLKLHIAGKGMLGFSDFTKECTSTGIKETQSVTKWDDTHMIPVGIRSVATAGSESSTMTSHTAIADIGSGNYFSYISEKEATDFDGNTTITTTGYDTAKGVITDETVRTDGGSMYKKVSYSGYVNKGGCLLPSAVTTEQKHKDSSAPFIHTTAYVYDDSGNITEKTENNGTEHALKTSFTYDVYGNVLSSVSTGKGVVAVTKYNGYDDSGRFVVKTYESPANAVNAFTYDLWGNMLTESDMTEPGNVLTTAHDYDGWGECIGTVSADGTTTQYTRGWGKSDEYRCFRKESVTDGGSKVTWYDNCLREVYVKTDGELNTENISRKSYDIKGNVIRTENKVKNLTVTEDMTYDSRGRILTSVSSSGRSVEYSYGNRAVTYESAGCWNTKTYDSWGNITSSSDPVSEVIYTYSSNGKPERITAGGHDITVAYDAAGNRTSLSDPDSGISGYEYAADGRLQKETDGRGVVTSYTFDESGRMSSSLTGSTLTTYTYGTDGYAARRLVRKETGGCSVEYTYDRYGRVIKEERCIADKGTYTFKYTYDSDNRLTKVSYPGGLDVTYLYDAKGFRTGVIAGNDTVCKVEEYDGLNYITSFKGKLRNRQTRDARGFISDISLTHGDDVIETLSLDYDGGTGNLLSRKRNDEDEETFEYDSLDRLVSVSRDGEEVMAVEYSADGNITYKTGVGCYEYDTTGKPHAVVEVDNTDGSISEMTQDIKYNDFGKIARISLSSLCTTNLKDLVQLDSMRVWDGVLEPVNRTATAFGNSVPAVKIDDPKYTDFIYGPDRDRWYSETSIGNVTLRSTVYAGGYEKITERGVTREFYYLDGNTVIVKQDGEFRSYQAFTDNIGSVLAIVDEDGNSVFEASYDAWGRQTVTLNDIGFRRGYTGHEMMNGDGLVNMNGRLYDPALGRFLSPDNYVQMPDNPQNFNRYTYCLNNPLKYNDPSGEVLGIDDLIACLLGGSINLVVNLVEGNVHSFWQGVALFATGALAGECALYGQVGVSAIIIGAGNSVINQGFNNGFNNIDWGQVGISGTMSLITSFVGGQVGGLLSKPLGNITSNISNTVLRNVVYGSLCNTSTGFLLGTGFSLLSENGAGFGTALKAGIEGAGMGLVTGAMSGFASGIQENYYNKQQQILNPQTDVNKLKPEDIVRQALSSPEMPTETGTNSVYIGRDADGNVRYVGITEREPQLRFKEHLKSNTNRSNLDYIPIDGTGKLSRIQSRIIEQNLINTYGLGKNGGVLYNKINSLSPKYWNKYGIIKRNY